MKWQEKKVSNEKHKISIKEQNSLFPTLCNKKLPPMIENVKSRRNKASPFYGIGVLRARSLTKNSN